MCHTHAKHWMECAGRHCSNWVVKKCSIIPRFLISPPDPLLVHRRRGGMGEKRRLRTGDRKLYDWSIDKWWPIIFPVSSSLGANSKMILLCMSGRSSLLTSPLYSHHHHPAHTVYCTDAPQVPTVCRARSPCYLALDGIWSLGSIIAIIILVFSCCSLVRTQQIISIIIPILVQHTTTKAMAYSNNYLPHHLGRHLPSNSFIISQLNPADQSIWSIPSLLVVLLFFSDPI